MSEFISNSGTLINPDSVYDQERFINILQIILQKKTQKELSEQTGLNNATISRMLNGARSGRPYKSTIDKIAKANFRPLIEAGVRIYLYTPGFIHSKCIVADDDTAIVGTCNLDFRSMYWNFEDFVYMYRTQCIGKIKEDAIETFAVSEEVYEESTNDISFAGRLLQSILQLFAPLL